MIPTWRSSENSVLVARCKPYAHNFAQKSDRPTAAAQKSVNFQDNFGQKSDRPTAAAQKPVNFQDNFDVRTLFLVQRLAERGGRTNTGEEGSSPLVPVTAMWMAHNE